MFWTPSPRRSVPDCQSLDSGVLEEEEEERSVFPAECWNRRRNALGRGVLEE